MLLGALNTGAVPATPSTTDAVDLPVGPLLLLYTDGLVGARHGALDEAIDALRRTLSGFGPDAPLGQLYQLLLEAPGARDDATVFAVRTSTT